MAKQKSPIRSWAPSPTARNRSTGAMAMFCAGHLFVLKTGNAVGGGLTGYVPAGVMQT